MIRPSDFDIRINETPAGVFVSVTHLPTANQRTRLASKLDGVARTRDALIAELRGLLYGPNDVRFDTGCSDRGDFIRVVHLPSGIERTAMRRESTHLELLDAILEELASKTCHPKHLGEANG
jgi:hypothetical protein